MQYKQSLREQTLVGNAALVGRALEAEVALEEKN